MQAIIITIGDELLMGQVIDTNSAWMATELNKIGIAVKCRIAVGDNKADIKNALDAADVPIVIITGGLGPTADDITKPLLCEYFGGKMILNEAVKQHIVYLFEQILKRPLIERNLKQAEVPDVCQVLFNNRGTAPGMLFKKNERVYISLPGVPFEMKGIMQDAGFEILKGLFQAKTVEHRTLITFGTGESFLAEKLKDFEAMLPASIKLAYLPHFGMVRLRLSTAERDDIDIWFSKLKSACGNLAISDRDESMQQIVCRLLAKTNSTLATAESCTGGYIAHLITGIPGSSQLYKGSIIAYHNEVKVSALQVAPATLQAKGAVSEEVVKEMLIGLFKNINTDYGIAVSGIMGPGGGTNDKPVGTVCIAVGTQNKQLVRTYTFRYERKINIEVTGLNALNLLREFITNERAPE